MIDRENPYFMIRLPNSCPLKYPSWFKINFEFSLEVKIHLSIFLGTKNFASFYSFQSLFSIELTKLNQSVVVQPVIKQVQFLVRRKMERSIFTSNKNFKFILNQLGYFKGQVFCSLIMKYRFSRSMLSFTENDLTYHA